MNNSGQPILTNIKIINNIQGCPPTESIFYKKLLPGGGHWPLQVDAMHLEKIVD